MTKRQLLDPEAGDLAVRMALGEAQVIASTKAALAGEDLGFRVSKKSKGRTGGRGREARGGQVAVRMALGQAQVVASTKAALAGMGGGAV